MNTADESALFDENMLTNGLLAAFTLLNPMWAHEIHIAPLSTEEKKQSDAEQKRNAEKTLIGLRMGAKT